MNGVSVVVNNNKKMIESIKNIFEEFTENQRQEFVLDVIEANSVPFLHGEDNYYMAYSFYDESIYIFSSKEIMSAGFYFESEEKVQEVIDFLGEEDILKYYFGVL